MSKEEAVLLMVVSFGAFLMPILSKRLNVPSPVLEIIFGFVIGFFFENFVEKTEVVKFLAELGFIILIYLAGLEINFEKIKKLSKKEIFLYGLSYILLAIISISIVNWLNLSYIYALVLYTVAIGLLYPVLKDTGILSTHFGQTLLIIGSIGEFLSLMAITVYFVIYKEGFSFYTLKHLGEIYLFFLIAYLLLKLFKLYIWWNPKQVHTFLKTDDVAETSVRANFANMFIFVSLATLLGLEPIIGAFFGGLLFALIFKEREKITEKLASFGYGFLIPIFFINVGLTFDIVQFFSVDIFIKALKLTALVLISRFIAFLPLLLVNVSIKQIFLISLSLSIPLTLMVAIASLGYEANIITKVEASVILLTAILTALIYPWMFKTIIKKYGLD